MSFSGKVTTVNGAVVQIAEGHPDRQRDLVLGALAHDLRSPLQAILMGIGIVARAGPSDAVISKMTSLVKGMERLIDQLLSFARTGTGEIRLARRPVALAPLCQELIGEVKLAHPRRTIWFGPPCDDASGEWDPDRLAQVVRNLLCNAVKHGDQGTPVWVTLRDTGDAAELSVANRGQPIPEELRAHLFEPFRRGSGDGCGLGLYIVDQLVRAHGGSIEVTSGPIIVFKVTLPKAR
jgi:sigma-B regulation protein RsbU (phosphoserine phosphatase)